MSQALFLNDRDAETDFSLYVSTLSGWPGALASAPRTVPLLSGSEMAGVLVDPQLVQRGAATATIGGIILTDTPASALAALDALRATLNGGEVAVRTMYAPDRECLAILTGLQGGAQNPQELNGDVALMLSFIVKDGVAIARAPNGYALSTTAVACPIGTAESRPVIIVHGGGSPVTNPVVTVRDAAGLVVEQMAFTGTLGATAALRIDTLRATVSLLVAGVMTDALEGGWWSDGDFPVLRPVDGWLEQSAWPSVELSAGSGTPVGSIVYARRWV